MNRYIHKTSVSESTDEELEDVGGFLAFFAYVPPSIQILIPVIIYLQLQFLQIPPLFSHFDTNA